MPTQEPARAGVAAQERRVTTSELLLGIWLLGLAGFVDAIAFSELSGNFVAFMSGNTTIAAVSMATGKWSAAALTGVLLGLFFVGCMIGAFVVRVAESVAHRLLMMLITVGILVCAIVANAGSATAGVTLVALVAGLMTSALATNSDVKVGLTYVTGTLVKSAHQLVAGIGTPHPWAWLKTIRFWFAFGVGAVIGGFSHHALHLGSMWIAVGLAVVLCFLPYRKTVTALA